MKSKKRHTVYYEETKEPILEYTGNERYGGGNLLKYERAMHSFDIPSSSEFLLYHLYALNAFLDDLYKALSERECARERAEGADRYTLLWEEYDEQKEEDLAQRNNELDKLRMGLVNNTLFRWHTDVMTREGEAMTGAYAVCYFSSWGAYTRSFHLLICTQPEKVPLYAYQCANDHRYCQMANKHKNIKITDASFIEYSVDDLWNSMRMVIPTLYVYTYSLPLRTYIYAHFFRYADLISFQQDEADVETVFDNPLFYAYNDDEEEGEPSLVQEIEVEQEEDMSMHVEGRTRTVTIQEDDDDDDDDDDEDIVNMFDAFKRLSIKASTTYSINNQFLFEGETIFYHQLYRINLSVDLMRLHEDKPKTIKIGYNTSSFTRKQFIKETLNAWHEMCLDIAKDSYLKQDLTEKYVNTRTNMHLYHGDLERYKRSFPNSSCDARDILVEVRPSEMTALNNTQYMVLGDILSSFKNAYQAEFQDLVKEDSVDAFEENVLKEGDERWLVLKYEQEALLLTKLGTCLFFQLKGLKDHKRMEKAFILEELTPLREIEKRVFLEAKGSSRNQWPIFLKLMRVYYVFDKNSDKIYTSLYFTEAYFVWLTLVYRYKLVKQTAIHPQLLTLVEKLNARIQC